MSVNIKYVKHEEMWNIWCDFCDWHEKVKSKNAALWLLECHVRRKRKWGCYGPSDAPGYPRKL